ncbi:MAG TPA: nucleotidyltransferase [Polyangiaceae bacterium]|nr:nucleotidyltransferase [Polyangiaceae bacterium]
MTDLPDDFRDMLLALADNGAEFVVIGGHAVAYHGHPRATKDLDVLVRATPENARRVYRALVEFGAPVQAFEVTEDDFAKYEGVLQIGVPPLRIDILTSIAGVSTRQALEGSESFELDGRTIPVIGMEALIVNKRAAGREQDRADVAALERLRRPS